MEVLAPAGSPEAAFAALAAGADALYCGLGSDFNARRSAHNFDDESFAKVCRAAHLAGARVYVTVNIVIKQSELLDVLALVRRGWLLGADAFIVQDWGLLREIHRLWPHIELHLSTQANIHDVEGVRYAASMGCSRVTVSRELSAQEIAELVQTGVEIECFGHGAICFCYSGVCQMSSLTNGRSANRGACAQPCRLPYDLLDEKGQVVGKVKDVRALCPKDYCTIDDIPVLLASGVGALKIEGRMKAPDYVYSVVRAYRSAVDAAAQGQDPAADEQMQAWRHRILARAFNRGFTNAYLHGGSDNDMMSYERSNNRGEEVGQVVASRKLEDALVPTGGSAGGRVRMKRRGRADIDVALDVPVGKGDLLELRPLSDPTQFQTGTVQTDASEGSVITIRVTRPVEAGSIARVIRSQEALDAAAQAQSRKREVSVVAVLRKGSPAVLSLTTCDDAFTATVEGFVVEPARTKALTAEEVVEHVGRMGTSAFVAHDFAIELDEGVGVSFSALHKLRADACEALEQVIDAPYRARSLSACPSRASLEAAHEAASKFDHDRGGFVVCAAQPSSTQDSAGYVGSRASESCEGTSKELEVCALVATAWQARAAQRAGAQRIYAAFDQLEDAQALSSDWIPWFGEVSRATDHPRIWQVLDTVQAAAVGTLGELLAAQERGVAAEVRDCVPVHNRAALIALKEAGAQGVWLGPELSLDELLELVGYTDMTCGYIVSGHLRFMTTEHCIFQATNHCIHDCPRCGWRARTLSLGTIDNTQLPVQTDIYGRSRIFDSRLFDATPHIPALAQAGMRRFMADISICATEREVEEQVARVAAALQAYFEGRTPAPRLAGASSGHLFSSIQ